MQTMIRITAILVLLSPGVVIAYDLLALTVGGPNATITHVVQWWARKYSELPWIVAGLLVFLWLHLFGAIVLDRLKE
jgi:hypothetical protein